MSLAPCHPSLRARVSDGFQAILTDADSHRGLGRQIGCAGTTITARGTELAKWPLLDALLLAAEHDGLRMALITCLQGADAPRTGDATEAFSELLSVVERDAGAHATIAQLLRDGRLSVSEARRAKQVLLNRRESEDRALLPALDACIGVSA